jgi:general secretion pathway protein F
MSVFAYEALDSRGRRQRGEIEADSERTARQLLKSRQLIARRLTAADSRQSSGDKPSATRLSSADTVVFLQQLATLSEAGMPLVESLASIAEGMSRRKARQAILAVRQSVVEGGSLADGLRAQQLEEVVINMIAAGEETGQLEAVSARLAEMLEHRQRLSNELLSATLYPGIILGFGILVMLFLMTVVVPQMVAVFARTGGNLPALTKVVIAVSEFLQHYGGWLIAGLAAIILAYRLLMRRQQARGLRDLWLLRMPALGSLLARIDTARFCRTLGMLLAGGVPTLAAMHIANQNWSMLPLRDVGEQSREALREGGSLSAALKASGYIPHMATQLIGVGEQSGRLDVMLIRVADHYEREVSQGLKRMLTVAEPLLVMLMALGVGALALAILLPIAEMNELVH